MKQTPDFFEGKDPKLLYIAKRLDDALALETLLNEAGVDYGVEADEYSGGLLFPSPRMGAFFYVLPEAVERATALLEERGYRQVLPPEA